MAPSTEQQHTNNTTGNGQQAVLDAQLQLWHHTLGYVRSMALKTALDLRIPDAIHKNGSSATLQEIAAAITLHPSKIPCLRRLMRVLTVTGIFSATYNSSANGSSGEPVYGLTPASRLLVSSSRQNMSPFLTMMLGPIFVTPFHGLGQWFQHELPDPSPFKMANGRDLFDLTDHNASFSKLFDSGMVADSSFVMDVVVKEYSDVFQGISSLVDVAGGLGGAAQIIATAFPEIECSVLDLPRVVASAPTSTKMKFIAGDMFESIPSANALFLKWVLHDWGDAECVKILKNCKKAIPCKEKGGKVIILDIVIGAAGLSSDQNHTVETQVLFDLFIMSINGAERDEQEWKKIIFEAGFSDYKIKPVLGVRSIIEAYP